MLLKISPSQMTCENHWALCGANDRINLCLSVVFKMFLLACMSFLRNIVLLHDSPCSSFPSCDFFELSLSVSI